MMVKRILTLLIAAPACAVFLASCSGDNVKNAAAGVTKKTVEVTKGTITGIDEGIEEGRKAAQSTDGAVIVSTGQEFKEALSVEILAVTAGEEEGTAEVLAGFANATATPIRVTELSSRGSVMVLDVDSYACEPRDIPNEFTVPANAKQKVRLVFACKSQKVGKLRLFGNDYDIPRDRIAEEQQKQKKGGQQEGAPPDGTDP